MNTILKFYLINGIGKENKCIPHYCFTVRGSRISFHYRCSETSDGKNIFRISGCCSKLHSFSGYGILGRSSLYEDLGYGIVIDGF